MTAPMPSWAVVGAEVAWLGAVRTTQSGTITKVTRTQVEVDGSRHRWRLSHTGLLLSPRGSRAGELHPASEMRDGLRRQAVATLMSRIGGVHGYDAAALAKVEALIAEHHQAWPEDEDETP